MPSDRSSQSSTDDSLGRLSPRIQPSLKMRSFGVLLLLPFPFSYFLPSSCPLHFLLSPILLILVCSRTSPLHPFPPHSSRPDSIALLAGAFLSEIPPHFLSAVSLPFSKVRLLLCLQTPFFVRLPFSPSPLPPPLFPLFFISSDVFLTPMRCTQKYLLVRQPESRTQSSL